MRDRARPSSGRPATRRCGAPILRCRCIGVGLPQYRPGYGCVPGT